MKNVKLSIIYYSSTGTNYQLARWAEEAAKNADIKEVRFRKVKELAPKEAIQQNEDWAKHLEATKDVQEVSLDDLEWADAIVFSAPTRYGNLPSQLASFFDTTGGLWFSGKLVNKVVTGMTSSQNMHGGQETTLRSLYKTMHHWGAIVVTPGYASDVQFKAGGNPYGVSVNPASGGLTPEIKAGVAHQVERMAQIAGFIKEGLAK
ncbi:NAD(P)H dehydrogenase (quinone) [Marivirga lumbricoides]|uniref:NAD(P)H dehydrogenase (Quinone) n=1 Tax=Marivirga lumbricoides TaxID=1046115 RepID=A0ABQ1MD28_9BACT|nr:NAD(P)H dehydrogenase (quinone) [Marivirga lumbricoides]